MLKKINKLTTTIFSVCLVLTLLLTGCQTGSEDGAATATPTDEPRPTRVYTPQELELKDKTVIKTPDLSGQEVNVLFLGNSFIASSQVADTLEVLAKKNGENLTAEWVSEGFATIESLSHHLDDNPKIKQGFYDAIFLCGVYSSETSALKDFLDAVEGTKTKILLFPASNESPTDIANARIAYPGSGYVGWLDIIYELRISAGFFTFDLCEDDGYLHLNPLGGCAGALMAYNYLYQETPDAEITEEYILRNFNVPGDTEEDRLKKARKMMSIAEELITGERPYNGKATV